MSFKSKKIRYIWNKLNYSSKKSFFLKKSNNFKSYKNFKKNKTTPHKKLSFKKESYNVLMNIDSNLSFYNFFTQTNFFNSKFFNKFYSEIALFNGIKFIVPYIAGLKPNYIYKFSLFDGSKFYKNKSILNNLSISSKNKIATSAGTFLIKLSENTYYLPSGCKKKIPHIKSFLPGKNFKLSNFEKVKKTQVSVRGIAKNPIDHPNGGNSNTKGSFKTPWGKIAKKNK